MLLLNTLPSKPLPIAGQPVAAARHWIARWRLSQISRMLEAALVLGAARGKTIRHFLSGPNAEESWEAIEGYGRGSNRAFAGGELDVLRLIGIGRSNKQIAHELAITPNTLKTHVSRILGKLGVESRTPRNSSCLFWQCKSGLHDSTTGGRHIQRTFRDKVSRSGAIKPPHRVVGTICRSRQGSPSRLLLTQSLQGLRAVVFRRRGGVRTAGAISTARAPS
jgi:Bacterial regulatory proteins, luxR family